MSTINMPTDPTPNLSLAEVAARLANLEREVEQLKSGRKDYSNWLDKIEGSMENDADFAEIMRLGQEIRKADFS